MNKTEKILEKYYSSIGELAQEFYRKYFFEEMLRDGEVKEEDFFKEFEKDVYRIGTSSEALKYFSDNSVFDFFWGNYFFDANDMYVALINNIPEKIVKNWYNERLEVIMKNENAYFPNLYNYFMKNVNSDFENKNKILLQREKSKNFLWKSKFFIP